MLRKILICGLSIVLIGVLCQSSTATAGWTDKVWDAVSNPCENILDCGSDDGDAVSFSDFRGTLSAPSGEGLDPALTRAGDARTFIVNTINLVLSFLGLIALVVVIYGGYLYVTAAGNEENSQKGKKAITYAGIGIIIVLASFAFVNTLISAGGRGTDRDIAGQQAGGGAGGEQLRGAAGTVAGAGGFGTPLDGANTSQAALYSFGAAELNAILGDFVRAYRNLINMQGILLKLDQVPAPKTGAENRIFISNISALVRDIRSSTNQLSRTNRAAKRMIDEYLFKFETMSPEDVANYGRPLDAEAANPEDETSEGGSRTSRAQPLTEDSLAEEVTKKFEQFKLTQAVADDYNAALDELIGRASEGRDFNPIVQLGLLSLHPDENNPARAFPGRIFTVWKMLGKIALETTADEVIKQGLLTEQDYQKAFAGLDPNVTVRELFIDTANALHAARALANAEEVSEDSSADTAVETITTAIKSLNRLYLIVRTIKFMHVRIAASVREGSIPFIVELNGLGSRDPSGTTISDDRYLWDPDGDGQPGMSNRIGECKYSAAKDDPNLANKGASVVCTYTRPGTYLVKLTVSPTDEQKGRIAAGEAFLTITAKPGVARITIKAKTNTREEYLRKYEPNDKGEMQLALDQNEFHVTGTEASAGIIFDAGESRDEHNQELPSFKWTFGDGSLEQTGPVTAKKQYEEMGRYPLTLEVKDVGGRVERKIIQVVISSVAAQITAPKSFGEPDELLEFDGSLSRSDKGRIQSYKWELTRVEPPLPPGNDPNILKLTDEVEFLGDETAPTIRVRFKKPGLYEVKLTVNDGKDDSPQSVLPLRIKSRAPRGNINIVACPDACSDRSAPSVVVLDASRSFDPDPGDTLSYEWHIYNDRGDESGYSIIEPENISAFTGPRTDAARVKLKFTNVGNYKAKLIVRDSQEGELQQEDTVERIFKVESIVEARWSAVMRTVEKLEAGVASFTIKGSALNADLLEVDYGDDSEEQLPLDADSGESAPFEFTHEYTKPGSYLVNLHALSEENKGDITIRNRLFVGEGDSPIGVIKASVNGQEVILPDTEEEGVTPALEVLRRERIAFDASDSLDAAGNQIPVKGRLQYSWDFADGTTSTKRSVDHSYSEALPDGKTYNVKLTVTDTKIDDPEKRTAMATFPVRVASKKPQLTALAMERRTTNSVTPVEVFLRAEGARDVDGRIANYQFWYFSPSDPERKLGVVDTTSDRAPMTVETAGEADTEHEYIFCVSLTDNENSTSECSELLGESELPRIRVKNGPNNAPTATLLADKTTVKAGEAIAFSSNSADSDGKIVSYVWDFDGDGFHNDTPTEVGAVTHTYPKLSARPIRVKLKVIDDKGAAGFSQELPISVLAKSNPPIVNFTYTVDPLEPRRVKFNDSTKFDEKEGARSASWKWDFDTSAEIGCETDPAGPNCNGVKTDDADSIDQNPIFDFPSSGKYQVKLTVVDSDGNEALATQFVNVIAGASGSTDKNLAPTKNILKAELKAQSSFGALHKFEAISGCVPDPARGIDCQKKVLHLPADVCNADVVLFWGDSRGDVQKAEIDTNIYRDSDGNGQRADEIENTSGKCIIAGTAQQQEKCMNRTYFRVEKTAHPAGSGVFRARLIVRNRDASIGASEDFVDIMFDKLPDARALAGLEKRCLEEYQQNLYGASLFKRIGTGKTIMLSLVSGVLLILAVFGLTAYVKRGKVREI